MTINAVQMVLIFIVACISGMSSVLDAFQHKADTYAKKGNINGIDLMHLGSLAVQAARLAIPSMLVAGGFIVVVGYAMIINMMEAKYLMGFFFLGFVIAAFSKFNLVAFGVIGAVFAIIYIQLSPKYHIPKTVAVSGSISGGDLDDELDD